MRLHQQINETVNELTVTPDMIRMAKGNKMHFIAAVPVETFLELTTRDNNALQQIKASCKTLNDYNRYATVGNEEGYKSVVMPMLVIDMDKEKVVGHEGRHRAAALMCAGATHIPVSFKLLPNDKLRKKYGTFEAPYHARFEDMPRTVQGEFGRGWLLRSTLTLIQDGLNKNVM